ncbi:PH domain-containing protein [Streptomyces sp. NPDC051183]|uniref:PH domain-containing protein n=1 Tax=unclassified Streptomyces TaxID=2593676 RepID=UPI00341B678C
MAVALPRTGTTVDRSGIEIRGPLRTRRLAWAEIQDIATSPVDDSSGSSPTSTTRSPSCAQPVPSSATQARHRTRPPLNHHRRHRLPVLSDGRRRPRSR